MLIGGPDHIQVAYVANLLQGAAQHWFHRECDAGRHPSQWTDLSRALIARFGNDTKPEQAQSTLMSMQQGKTESAHDYALHFEIVLERFLTMMSHGYRIYLFGDCNPIWRPRSTCKIQPRSIELFALQRRQMWPQECQEDRAPVGVAVYPRKRTL